MSESHADKLKRIKEIMGNRYALHPDYNKHKPVHHTTRERNSTLLQAVRAEAVAAGRL